MSHFHEDDSRANIELIPDTRIAAFRWEGPITLDQRRKCRHAVIAFCREHRINKLLVDGRKQISQTDTIDSFEYASEVPAEMIGIRIAVLHREDDETLPFIETVAYNRGSSSRSFTDYDEAKRWLEAFDD